MYFKNTLQPFGLLLGGHRAYIILDYRHMAESYKKTKEILYEPFVDHLMVCVGVPQATRDTVWGTKSDNAASTANYVLDSMREELSSGTTLPPSFDRFPREVDDALQGGTPLTTGQRNPHSLLEFTDDMTIMDRPIHSSARPYCNTPLKYSMTSLPSNIMHGSHDSRGKFPPQY